MDRSGLAYFFLFYLRRFYRFSHMTTGTWDSRCVFMSLINAFSVIGLIKAFRVLIILSCFNLYAGMLIQKLQSLPSSMKLIIRTLFSKALLKTSFKYPSGRDFASRTSKRNHFSWQTPTSSSRTAAVEFSTSRSMRPLLASHFRGYQRCRSCCWAQCLFSSSFIDGASYFTRSRILFPEYLTLVLLSPPSPPPPNPPNTRISPRLYLSSTRQHCASMFFVSNYFDFIHNIFSSFLQMSPVVYAQTTYLYVPPLFD